MTEDYYPDTQPLVRDENETSAALGIALALNCLEYVGENVFRLDQNIAKLESPASYYEPDLEDTMFSTDSFNHDSEFEMFSVKSQTEFSTQLSMDDSSTIFDDIHEDLSTMAGSEPDEEIALEEPESNAPRRSSRLVPPINIKPSPSTENCKPQIKRRRSKKKCDEPVDDSSKPDYRVEARVRKMLDEQKAFMISLAAGKTTEVQVQEFIVRGFRFVAGKCCALTANSFKLHTSLKLVLVNVLKIFDFQTRRGCIDVALLLEQFMKDILTKFTKHSSQMNSRSRRWLFAYELLATCIHIVSHSAVLTGLEAFLLEFHLTFIKFNILTKRRPSKVSIEYRSYVSEQLSSLVSLISHRLGQIAHKERYNLIY